MFIKLKSVHPASSPIILILIITLARLCTRTSGRHGGVGVCGRSQRTAAAVHGRVVGARERVRVRARCGHSHAPLSIIITRRDR